MSRWKLMRAIMATAALAALACSSHRYTLETVADAEQRKLDQKLPPFLLLADTQYSVPGTDYDVSYDIGSFPLDATPSVTTRAAGSFYRHAAANHVLPDVLDRILSDQARAGVKFGIFGGDMVEFACEQEADDMFRVLKKHPELPIIIALGNHDALFHGSYDTDATMKESPGAWDRYSMRLWEHVCKDLGGPLSKPDFINRVIDYYDEVWKLGIRRSLENAPAATEPAEEPVHDLTLKNGAGWTVRASIKLWKPDQPDAHRHSHLWQRFVYEPDGGPSATFSVLDTTDYAQHMGLCQWQAMIAQLGMGGAVSFEQARWFAGLQKAKENHFVLSHYLPALSVKKGGETMGQCELTKGADCLWKQWVRRELGPETTFVYGHVHDKYARQLLTDTDGDDVAFDVVRVPSLIDNRAYVVFRDGAFKETVLTKGERMESEPPFKREQDTCVQRHRELIELTRNVACFKSSQGCEPLATVHQRERAKAASVCNDDANAWKRANEQRWGEIAATECKGWTAPNHWRCILRAEGRRALATIAPEQRGNFALGLLGAVRARRE